MNKRPATHSGTAYDRYQQHRQELSTLMRHQQDLHNVLGMAQWAESITQLMERLLSDTFKVLVVGEFKRGKSTFINALLREEVLPAYALPCTAIINEVKWGDKPRALLHYRKDAERFAATPLEIPVDDLKRYVVIDNSAGGEDASTKEQIRESRYEKAELFWPLALCRKGVEIVDSPGLNENEVRQRITMDYLTCVDAVLFVFMCVPLGSTNEMDFIKNVLLPSGHEDVFFICNCYDQVREKEREAVRRYAISKLSEFTRRGSERVFFVSAREALDGYLENDPGRVRESNMPDVEAALERFLATDKGQIKLIRPINTLRTAIRDARNTIPSRLAMLNTSQDTLQRRYNESKLEFEALENERRQIVSQITEFRSELNSDVQVKATAIYNVITGKIVEWAANIDNREASVLIAVGVKPTQQQIDELVEYVRNNLCQQLERETGAWLKQTLLPHIDIRIASFQQDLDARARKFLEKLDDVRMEVAHGSSARRPKKSLNEKVSPMDKLLARSNDVVIPALGPNLTVGGGYGMAFKATIPSIVVGTLAFFLSAWNPVILGGMMITALLSVERRSAALTKEIKRAVGNAFAAKVEETIPQEAARIAELVTDNIHRLESAVDLGLGKQVQDIREQAESVLEEMRKGEQHVKEKVTELDSVREKLDAVDLHLGDLIEQVIA